ncbi:hypothetical protein DID88_004050 [Monilinia fructigena]|uniref:Pyruvate kinase n=1 Tax=Monilinia fructigena TaxID=38457 RepID=A0A395IS33_9HELO|nr:hypothetical protein DID88_004050 [Monilinia fructigena]
MATAMDHLVTGTSKISWLANLNTEFKPTKNYRPLNKLRVAGLNVVRMNFSHGSYEYHQSVIDNAREAEKVQAGRQLAIALDTKGPEIRTGNTAGDVDIPISAGSEIKHYTDDKYATACDDQNMYVDYKNITKIVDEKTIRCRARNNGKISSKKGVNLPNTDVDLPALSEKDQADLRFGVKNNVDMVFASFIRRGEDIKSIRLNNFPDILKETDGVMVARGDLGIEIPAAEVFAAQKKMIAMCNMAGKPVICATQMLESMIYNPRPTRAEISDVGNAVTDVSVVESCAMAAVRASLDINAGAIIVLSTSGESARLLSKYRPVCPIFMVTEMPAHFSKVNWQEDVDRRIKWGIAEALKLKVLAQGESVVVVQGWKGGMGNTNTLRVIKAEPENLGLEQV